MRNQQTQRSIGFMTAITITAAVGIAVVVWSNQYLRSTLDDVSKWRTQSSEIRFELVTSQLAFEQFGSRDESVDFQTQVVAPLRQSGERCSAIQIGGSISLTQVPKLGQTDAQGVLSELCPKLNQLLIAAEEEQRNQVEGSQSTENHDAAQEHEAHDALFFSALRNSQQLEREIEQINKAESNLIHNVNWITVAILSFLALGAAIAVRRRNDQLASLVRRNTMVLNAAGDAIYGLDKDMRFVFANPATGRLIGADVEDLIGKQEHTLMHHTHSDGTVYEVNACPMYRTIVDGVSSEVTEELFWKSDGSSFPAQYTSTPVAPEGQGGGKFRIGQQKAEDTVRCVVVMHDISERKALERAKDEFISLVSHELRTPLTSIRGSLGLLAGGAVGEMPASAKRMIDIAAGNTDRLVRLINDILDIERMESGKASMHRVELNAGTLVTQAVDEMRGMATEAAVELIDMPVDVHVWADSDRIVQTLTNLIGNAIKFSPPKGQVVVSVEVDDSEKATFLVSDRGRGIPAEKIDSIFGRFQQVDASDSREKGGSGLGLAICQSIVHQHEGEIWVESVLGEGSTFSFTLPISTRRIDTSSIDLTANLDVTRTVTEATGPRVLVVDDDPAVLEVVCEILARKGYKALPASSGQEALALAKAERPDALVLDLVMPGTSGWEVLAGLRQNEITKDIPVVVLSILSGEGIDRSNEGSVAKVDKPFDNEALFSALKLAVSADRTECRVVVVEDDIDLATVLVATFARHGIQAVPVHTFARALDVIPETSPDLIVLDLTLPDGNGADLLERLRADGHLQGVPVVVYTGQDLGEDEINLAEGVDVRVFTKSRVSIDEFEESVLGLLGAMLQTRR